MKLGIGVDLVGGIGEQILLAECAGDQAVNVVEIIFLLGLEELAAGALRDLLHDLLAVDRRLAFAAAAMPAATAGPAPAAARITATRITAAHSAVMAWKLARLALFLAFEVNGENLHAGAIGCIDGIVKRFLAAAIDAVGEDQQRLAAVLGLHQLVACKIDRV